jgi:hypothetical protein
VRAKQQAALAQLPIDQQGARFELRAGDGQLEIAEPHFEQLLVG